MSTREAYNHIYSLLRADIAIGEIWYRAGELGIAFNIVANAIISFADRYNVDKYDDLGEWQRKYYAASEELQAWKRKYLKKRYRINNRIAYAA